MMRYGATDIRRSIRVHAIVFSMLALPAGAAAQRAHVDTAGLCLLDHREAFFAFQVSQPAAYVGRSGGTSRSPHPVKPTAKSRLVLGFIVDTTGRVDSSTVRTYQVRDSALLRETLRELSKWIFLPAVWHRCAVVRQFVQVGVVR